MPLFCTYTETCNEFNIMCQPIALRMRFFVRVFVDKIYEKLQTKKPNHGVNSDLDFKLFRVLVCCTRKPAPSFISLYCLPYTDDAHCFLR